MKNSKRVLVIGCGNLGIRHFQAVASLPYVCELDIVDPNQSSLDKGLALWKEMPEYRKDLSVRWLTSLEGASKEGDLCIVATQAKGRCDIVFQVQELLGHEKFLLEKIVSQSIYDYDRLIDLANRKKLSIWVNCKGRVHFSHSRVKSKLKQGEPFTYHVVGGNHGLANNGNHCIDLFCFFDECKEIISDGSQIDQILHPSKRGPDVYDLSGSLKGHTSNGSQLVLSFLKESMAPISFSFHSPSYRAVVDDSMKIIYESSVDDGWTWGKVPFEANLMVSNMTRGFADQILNQKKCQLPTLEECYPSHKFIFSELQPHFRKLLNLNYCPVT